jgi:toxin CcdB
MILQSDLADTARERVVAPLAPRAAMPPFAGQLLPVVTVLGNSYATLVPSLTTMAVADLRHPVGNLAGDRDRIMAALDYLFIGF